MGNSRSRPRARTIVIALVALGALTLSACSGTSNEEYEKQIADLESQLVDTEAELESTRAELETTQAELLDAQAQLAKVGELVLTDATYTGQVLAAKASPYRIILFDAAGLWRVAEVAIDATMTSGGQGLTLEQLGKLLRSTNPDDINLVNGNYQVIVKGGVVTSLRKWKS
jgi:hypothetical protein